MFSDEVLMKKDRKFDRNEGKHKQRPRNEAPDKRQAIKDSMEWTETDYDDQHNRRGKHERRRRETDSDSR